VKRKPYIKVLGEATLITSTDQIMGVRVLKLQVVGKVVQGQNFVNLKDDSGEFHVIVINQKMADYVRELLVYSNDVEVAGFFYEWKEKSDDGSEETLNMIEAKYIRVIQ